MAKNRYINTHFWNDGYTIDLNPTDKLLFLYCLTNGETNMHGVYEISLRKMAFETGIDIEMVKKLIERFSKDEKIYYEMGYIVVKNFVKHQTYNPKTAKAVVNHFNALPAWLKRKLLDPMDQLHIDYDELCIAYGYTINADTLSLDEAKTQKPKHRLSHNINSNSNLNSNLNNKPPISPAADDDEIQTGPQSLDDGF